MTSESRPDLAATALGHIRVCDLGGQLAGAGATRFLAAMGAEVIRVEDPVREGRWDVLRGSPPYHDERRGIEFGGGFNNHNVEKKGVTLNLRTDRGRDLLRELITRSDVVTENFRAGVMERMGFGYEQLQQLRADIIYVSNSGFGHSGPYHEFKSWGPIVQAVSGLTFSGGLPGELPSGWGYSYMDHHGANFMAIAVLAALVHRRRTGEGQWIDMACTEAGATMCGPAILDSTVNGRPLRRPGQPDSNRSLSPLMVPHNVYPAAGDDEWVAVAVRDDRDRAAFVEALDIPLLRAVRFATIRGRYIAEADIDAEVAGWSALHDKFEVASLLKGVGVPSEAVRRPAERIDGDPTTTEWGLWPKVQHPEIGEIRVDGIPVHFSLTDWRIERGAPLLGEHNRDVLCGLLGIEEAELADLRAEGVT